MKVILSKVGLVAVGCLFTLFFLFYTELGFFDKFRIPIGSLFAGLLALVGFLFTARTFITFKLNDVVYSNELYRSRVEQLRKDGAYKNDLYGPLKELDDNLGKTSLMCLASLILVLILGFFPEFKTVVFPATFTPYYFSDIPFSTIGWTLLRQHGLIMSVLVYKVYSSITLAFLVITVFRILDCIFSVNRNIKAIIRHWEDDYNKTKDTDAEDS